MKHAITRWKFDGHPDGPLESADGEYVEYADHVAEIARLRALVREAFHEGFKAAYCTALTDGEAVAEFDRSDAKKALDQ